MTSLASQYLTFLLLSAPEVLMFPFPFSFPSKKFSDDWGHLFWMSLVAVVLSLFGGSLRLLPWFIALEIMDFARHIMNKHDEEPRHPALRYVHYSGLLMTGFVVFGMLIAPNVTRTYAASKIPGAIVMMFVTLPLLVVQRIVSKNIHPLYYGGLQKMYSDDREERMKGFGSLWWDAFGFLTMLLISRVIQLAFIVK